MYNKLSWLWPVINPPEDYINETRYFSGIVKKYSKIKVKTLLHIGCGAGHNDFTLKKFFKVTGIDISNNMLKLARKLNPECEYINADMRYAKLGKIFDAVAVFDSINYITSEHDLLRTFRTAYRHLKPGGIFLIFVERIPETLRQNQIDSFVHTFKNKEIAVIENLYDRNRKDNIFEVRFVYIIHNKNKTTVYNECHLNGIFKLNTWKSVLKKADFKPGSLKVNSRAFPPDEIYYMLVCKKN